MNQDGLENFFGCLRACQNSSSLVPMHFRSAYATLFVSNQASSHSIKSNCEPDMSKPLLTEMHDVFLSDGKRCECQTNENDTRKCCESVECEGEKRRDSVDSDFICNTNGFKNDGYEYDYDPISVGMKFSQKEVTSVNSISDAANTVCSKLLKVTKCPNCKDTIETRSKDKHTINHPSDLFKINFQTVLSAINNILPQICEEKFVKKKLLKYIDEDVNIEVMGCYQHHEEVMLKFMEYSSTWGILTFCKDVNYLLSGKNLQLPKNYNFIEENAFKFRETNKRIGKHSDVLHCHDNVKVKKNDFKCTMITKLK